MAKSTSPKTKRKDYGMLGVRAAQAGEFDTALEMLEKAVSVRKPSNDDRFNLAIVCEQVGDIDRSAELLTQVLRVQPTNTRAAQRLSALCRRFEIGDGSKLDPFGLRAGLVHPATDPQTFAKACLTRLLSDAAFVTAIGDPDGAAGELAERVPPWANDPLLHVTLERTLNTDPHVESLLAACRRTLLDLTEERFADKALTAFALVLAKQFDRNEFVVVAQPDEVAALDALSVDLETRAGSNALLVRALYSPITSLLPPTADDDMLSKLRPTEFRTFAKDRVNDRRAQQTLATHISTLSGDALTADDVSKRVARQYEVAPYPRWDDIELPDAGWLKTQLPRMVPTAPAAFLDGDFDVLIAGAGTGRQAVQSANGFGPSASVVATDLSAASLAYAQTKAEGLGLSNVTFRQQNILELDPAQAQFDVIECLGVLHHMAEPLEGWRRLIACLKPGGLMQIALYSKISRADIVALRGAADHPGADCTNDEARAYRAGLAQLPDDEPGGSLKYSLDFYTLSTFRDLLLHQSEQQFTLTEIAEFLDGEGMQFHGFVLDPMLVDAFLEANPDEEKPGTLAAWATHETQNPQLFSGMYQFYCSRIADT